jgi:hypothetical protein
MYNLLHNVNIDRRIMKPKLLMLNILLTSWLFAVLSNSGFAQLSQQLANYPNNATKMMLPFVKNNIAKNNVELHADFNVKISPNPTSGWVKVTVAPIINGYKQTLLVKIESSKAELYDLKGNLIFEKTDFGNEVELDMSHCSAGVYFVKIYINNKEKKDLKIMKN